jgi:hypothetical protein
VVAFEFENRPKTEAQLKEKLFRLKAVIESNDAPFEACLVVTSTDSLKKKIQALTSLIPNKFIVQSVSEIEAASLKLRPQSNQSLNGEVRA